MISRDAGACFGAQVSRQAELGKGEHGVTECRDARDAAAGELENLGPRLIAGSVRTGPVLAEGGGAKPPSPPRRPGRPTNLPASLELTSVAALHAYLTGRLGALKGIRHVETAPTGRRIKRAGPLLARRRSAGHAQAHRLPGL